MPELFDPSLFSDDEEAYRPPVKRKPRAKKEQPSIAPATDKKRKRAPPASLSQAEEDLTAFMKEYKKQVAAERRKQAKEVKAKARQQTAKDVQQAIRLGRETTTEDNIVTPEPLVKKEAEVKVHNRKRVRVAKNEGKDILTRTYVIKLYPVRPSDDEQENQEGSDLIIQTSSHTLEPDTTSSSSPSTE